MLILYLKIKDIRLLGQDNIQKDSPAMVNPILIRFDKCFVCCRSKGRLMIGQTVCVMGIQVVFIAGKTMHGGDAYKYRIEQQYTLTEASDLVTDKVMRTGGKRGRGADLNLPPVSLTSLCS